MIACDDVTGGSQHQRKGHIGHGAIEQVGCVAYGDATRLGVSYIDMIDPYAKIANHTQIGHQVHLRPIDLVMTVHQIASHCLEQLGSLCSPCQRWRSHCPASRLVMSAGSVRVLVKIGIGMIRPVTLNLLLTSSILLL